MNSLTEHIEITLSNGNIKPYGKIMSLIEHAETIGLITSTQEKELLLALNQLLNGTNNSNNYYCSLREHK